MLVWGLGFRVLVWGLGVSGSSFGVQGLTCRDAGLGLGFQPSHRRLCSSHLLSMVSAFLNSCCRFGPSRCQSFMRLHRCSLPLYKDKFWQLAAFWLALRTLTVWLSVFLVRKTKKLRVSTRGTYMV